MDKRYKILLIAIAIVVIGSIPLIESEINGCVILEGFCSTGLLMFLLFPGLFLAILLESLSGNPSLYDNYSLLVTIMTIFNLVIYFLVIYLIDKFIIYKKGRSND